MTEEMLKNELLWPYKIPEAVNEYARTADSNYGFAGWIREADDDIILRIYAYRRRKNKPTDVREVLRICPSIEGLYQRDMYLTAMSGWRVIFKPEKKKSANWYGYSYYNIEESEWGKWYWAEKCGIFYQIINPEAIKKTRYKYSGWQQGLHIDLIAYLRLWNEEPAVEYFGKAGITPSKALIRKAKKDREFITWLRRFDNIEDYNPQAIIYAYDHKKSLKEACDELIERHRATAWAMGYFKSGDYGLTMKDIRKIYAYAYENGIGAGSYRDYLQALRELNMDLTDTKNIYPQNFRRMHDLRTNQAESKRKKIKVEEFRKATEKFQKYETKGEFIIRIPKAPEDLKKEGKALEHCVGSMGYDNKMCKGVSFIAFLRKPEEPETPYVTIEYGIEQEKILQIYGHHDSKPAPEVLAFARKWARKVRKIQKGAEK